MSGPLLKVEGVAKHFGGFTALSDINVQVMAGERLGLIGPNGSGKSTTVNLIAGLFKPTAGAIHFKGQDIGDLAQHQRCELGIARTFQNIRLFGNLTVWQNIWAARVVRASGWAGIRERWLSGAKAARDRKSTRLNSSHVVTSRMPSSA